MNKENISPGSVRPKVTKHSCWRTEASNKTVAILREKKNSTLNRLGRASAASHSKPIADTSSGLEVEAAIGDANQQLSDVAATPISTRQDQLDFEAIFVAANPIDIPIPDRWLQQIEYVLDNDEAFDELMDGILHARRLLNPANDAENDMAMAEQPNQMLARSCENVSHIPVHIESQRRRRSQSATPFSRSHNSKTSPRFNTTFIEC